MNENRNFNISLSPSSDYYPDWDSCESSLNIEDMQRMAEALYDGGWRAEDHDQLMSEYDLTSDEADAICEALKDIEESNASSEDDE